MSFSSVFFDWGAQVFEMQEFYFEFVMGG